MAGFYTQQNVLLAEPVFRLEVQQRDRVIVADRCGLPDYDFIAKCDEAETHQVVRSAYQTALELHDKLEARGEGYRERARVRFALANYLRYTIHPATGKKRYLDLADKLERARPWGVYGVDFDEKLVIDWAQRAGLVKLCPDDARDEGMRAAAIYGQRIEELQKRGYEVRFAVFTVPNAPRWHLGACMDSIFARLRETITHARSDGLTARSFNDKKRAFPLLRGAVATLEAPLSAAGEWNVHLNVLMVFQGRPDYKALREAWGANVEFRTVPTGAGPAALRELVKYPLKAVALKSEEKRHASAAPPVIEWPPDAFDEWWCAHHRFRRTRSWGELYAGSLPKRDPDEPRPIDWLGKVKLSPAAFRVELPMPDTRDLDRRQRAGVDLILGNKSAPGCSRSGLSEGARARPPPEGVNGRH